MAEKKNSQNTGAAAEEIAREYLKKEGYMIRESNWRFKKYEIDIIAENDEVIIFAEVKGRTESRHGEPEEFVNRKKQRFIVTAANHYIQKHDILKEARFDILSVLLINGTNTVKHLPDAWYAAIK